MCIRDRLLDEPAAGLSREDKATLGRLLRRIADSGVAVGLVEHDMSLVMDVSDNIVVIDAGQHLAAGTPDAVRTNPAVMRAYLGEASDAPARSRPATAQAKLPLPEVIGVSALRAG